jgi:protein-tyrosine phosphatase
MHTPAWKQAEPRNFEKIESLLTDRPYTIFAGHTHTYEYNYRYDRHYIIMGMTGGGPPSNGVGHMDHIAWVTMTEDGPVISNILQNGIMDKRGAVPAMKDYLLFNPRQIILTGQSLGIRSVPNLRDLGGYTTESGGIVRNGLLYRSNQLSGISPEDMQKISKLNLNNVMDLRTKAERDVRPEELPEGTNYVILDVLADADQAGPAMLEKLLKDPAKANEALGDGKAAAGFQESYRQFVSLPSAQKEFGRLFASLGDKEQLPALFHCTTGKDRTGWAAAAFFTLVGVSEDQIYEDYLRSNDYILPLYKKVIDDFVAAGGEESIPLAILGVKKEYLDAAFDEMKSKYGTIENYFSEGLGIDADQQKAIKALYLGYQ